MDIKKGLGMAKSYAKALASRGLNNKKTEPYTKRLRVLSCFGNQHTGGQLPPCEHLKSSKTEGKYFCGGCGCGDRKTTWLIADGDEYSKLDFPNLSCPLKMPGFSNYSVSEPEEAIPPITRRYFIENMSEDQVNKVEITDIELSDKMKADLEKIEKDIKKD